MLDLGRALILVVFCLCTFCFAVHAATPDEVDKRALAILKKMTLDEKLDYIGGINGFYIRGSKRLGLPEFRMADGPIGVRNFGPSTAYAAGIALAASWDEDLAGRVGAMIGKDARARGVHFLLGPGVNIYRTPLCGRNFEYFGEDPFLAARMTASYVKGVQAQGVSATVKHFMGNNSEYDRHHTSSEIDERTMREIYLPAFEAAVREAKVGAIMNSYNLVGGVHATQHDYLNNRLAKREWGWGGVLMSDWDATYDGVAAANAGLDLEMPSGRFMNRANLGPAIKGGKVSIATIDEKVLRILRTAIRFGWLDREQTDRGWPLYAEAGRKLALETARASMVLLKNQDGLLPLDKRKVKTVAVIGPNAYPAVPVGGGSAQVRPFVAVSYLEGLSGYLGGSATVTWSQGLVSLREIFEDAAFVTAPTGGKPGLCAEYFANLNLTGAPVATRTDRRIHFGSDGSDAWPAGLGRQFSARWNGFFVPNSSGDHRFSISSYGLDGYRLFVDGKKILDRLGQPQPIAHATLKLRAAKAYAIRLEYVHFDHHARLGLGVRKADALIAPEAKQLAARADVAVVLAGFDPSNEGEGQDRTFQLPAGQDELVATVRNANPNTIVVVTSGGGVDMSRWVDGTRAVVQAWYPGQEGGHALAQLLFGDFSPSGKLPVTFERRLQDNATHDNYLPDPQGKIRYREGVFLGYRHFDKTGRKPLFPFGHGLSYTTFKYANLAVKCEAKDQSLVAFDVTNQGRREGAEVAQVYVGDRHAPLPRPPKELKGFAKVKLAPGKSQRVQIALDRRAFSYFDAKTMTWTVAPGEFEILVGSSAQHIELRGKVRIE
ncbi:MAG: glycoside hydrolase family 3 C-terminal domain-containing protein [Deltaproteobacteria bacterium]|nr:glycoside hydrolase family 3 C-terminal domain-containing protein [Deltaproteobacteria bacterium]